MELLRSKNGRMLIESHRGAEDIAPANSWEAIKKGFELGADLIEIDVQLSADNVAFIRHNYTIANNIRCRSFPFLEIEKMSGENYRLPRLMDVFRWAKEVGAQISLDMKGGFGMSDVLYKSVIPLIRDSNIISQILMLDWNHSALLEVKEIFPAIKTRAMIRGCPIELVQLLKKCKADAVSLSYDLLTSKQVEILHDQNIAVMMAEMWQPDFQYAEKLGIDIVSWGNPAKVWEFLGK